jgi:hypothetical protein
VECKSLNSCFLSLVYVSSAGAKALYFWFMQAILFLVGVVWAQLVLIDGTSADGSFETQDACGSSYAADGWSVVNGSQTHRWAVGTLAGAHHGNRAIFISDQADCSAYQYDIAGEDVVHFYRDITVPAGYAYVKVSFYARLQGDRVAAYLYDYLGVYWAPTSVTPTPGTLVNSSYQQVGAALISNEWTYFETHICGVGPGTYRLIFSWRTTNTNPSPANSGTQPPAAIDRIHVVATNTLPTVVDIPALPYSEGRTSTCGMLNDFSATNVAPYCNTSNVGYNMYRNGEDRVWRFTASATGEIRIRIWGTSTYSHWTLYEGGNPPTGCSDGLSGGTCIAEEIWGGGDRLLYACVTAGQTYYLVFNQTQSTITATNCGKFDSLLIEPLQVPIYGATAVTTLPYSHGPGSTCGQRDRFNHANSGSCGMTTYNTGNDLIWQFSPATSGNVTIQITNSSTYTGWAVYCGGVITCGDGLDGATCLSGGIFSGGNRSMTIYAVAGMTYYLVVNHYGPPHCGNFDNLTISAPVPASPPASYPCTPLTTPTLSLQGKVRADGAHELSWKLPPQIDLATANLYLAVQRAGEEPHEIALPAAFTEYVMTAPGGRVVTYRLRVETGQATLYSQWITLHTDTDVPSLPQLQVIASPGANRLIVQVAGMPSEPLRGELYDALGRLCRQYTLSISDGQSEIELGSLPRGLYIFRVYGGGAERVVKFLYLP